MASLSPKQRRRRTPFRPLFFISVHIVMASALRNVTVDDETGDELTGDKPTYTPEGADGNWEQGATCTQCVAKPDPSKAHGGTWHDTTHNPGDLFQREISISFNGTAVYAFFICANTVPGATTLTNLTFALDGGQAGTFVHEPTSSTDYEYNVPGYVNTSLSEGNHQLVIQTTGDENASLILFDYLMYSTNQAISSPSTSSTSSASTTKTATTSGTATATSTDQTSEATTGSLKIGSIIGIAAAAAGVSLAAFAFIWWRRRKLARRKRVEVDLNEEGSNYSLYNAASAMPYSNHSNSSSEPLQSDMAESQYFLPTSEQPSTLRSTMSASIPVPFAVQNQDGSDVGRSDISTASSVVGGNVAASAAGVVQKARERQTEIVRQVEEMQQRVALLRSRSTASESANRHGGVPTESVAGSTSDSEAELRTQIATLQAEVERLQSQQEYYEQLGWGAEPPPEYAPVEDGAEGDDHAVLRHS